MTLRTHLLRLALGAALAAFAAEAQADPAAPSPKLGPCDAVWFAASATSDYRYDGFSESNREPTWQVNLHCWRTDGFYAGTELTGVNFEDHPRTGYEADFYAGKHIKLWASDLNLEVLFATFPSQRTGGPSYGFAEPSAELSHDFGKLKLSSLVGWSPNDSGNAGQAWHVRQTAAYALTDWLFVSGHLGRWWIARGVDRDHYDIGATTRWRHFSLDVRYGGTDLPLTRCYYTQWCAPGPSVTLTYGAVL